MPFNPAMLTLAKNAAGLTQAAIAQHAGISQSLMSKIENGFEAPSPIVLQLMAAATGAPINLFEQPDATVSDTVFDIFHKKRLTLPQKPLRKANANAQLMRLEVGRLLRSLDVPAHLPFPSLPLDEHESVAEIARLTRAIWRTTNGPLPDLIGLVEATGTPVVVTDLEHEKLRALSMPGIQSHSGHLVVLNGRLPASAQRFALAHEIGHLIMHEGVATQAMEKEADDFASSLLMPAADIGSRLRNVRFRDLGQLKSTWRVSLAALIYRAHDLGLISDRHYRTLNLDLSKLPNGRRREPGEFAAEQPTLIRKAINVYVEQLGYSDADVARLMVVTGEKFSRSYVERASDSRPTRFTLLKS